MATALTFGLAACGAPGPAASGASTPSPTVSSSPVSTGPLDVCKLATQAEVNAAAGMSLGPATVEGGTNPGDNGCVWSAGAAPVNGRILTGISVVVSPIPTGTSTATLIQRTGGQAISGLGDAAAGVSRGAAGPVQVFVIRGSNMITLMLISPGGAPRSGDPLQSMTVLARAILGRYPG